METTTQTASTKTNSKAFYPWIIWGLAAAFFFAEYFARVSPSVMVPDLMRSFATGAFGVGSLSAFFYYAYISMQVPVGALVDRFGAHRLLTVTAVICALGCVLFAVAQDLWMAKLARLLMGFGAAFAFVGALKLATLWFPGNRFGLLAGLTQALGMLGVAVSLSTMSLAVHAFGWRHTMWMIGFLLLLLAVLIGLLVRDRPTEVGMKVDVPKVGLWQGFVMVLRNRQSWINALYVGLLYAPTAAFAELWGVSFLVHAYNFSTEVAATAVGCIFIGWAIGGPIMGWISDHMRRRKPALIFSIAASLVLMCLVLYIPNMWPPLLFLLLFLYGVANTGVAISYAVASEINPHPIAGTSMAFANMASVIIGAAFQPIIGWLLDLQWNGEMLNGVPLYSTFAYRSALLALPLCLLIGLVAVWWLKETFCRRYEER